MPRKTPATDPLPFEQRLWREASGDAAYVAAALASQRLGVDRLARLAAFLDADDAGKRADDERAMDALLIATATLIRGVDLQALPRRDQLLYVLRVAYLALCACLDACTLRSPFDDLARALAA
jgi:hypothetical protein